MTQINFGNPAELAKLSQHLIESILEFYRNPYVLMLVQREKDRRIASGEWLTKS